MAQFEILPVAEDELREAVEYYAQQSIALGNDLLAKYQDALAAIQEAPERWPRPRPPYRRYRMKKFPFGIFYRVLPDRIRVVAIAHARRRPGYWLDRQ